MSIQAINNFNSNLKVQTFKSNQSTESAYQQESSSNTKYWVLGGLAALAAVGTYLIMRGRGKKAPVENPKEQVSQIKDFTLQAFKDGGNKFESGRAKLANGDNLTGKISKRNADKSVLILEYKDGILQKSSKLKDGKTIFSKNYTHNASGNLRAVVDKDGKNLEIKLENDVKKIKTRNNNSIEYDVDKKMVLSYQKNGGKKKEYYYRDDDKKTLKYLKEDDKITKYDKDGKTVLFTATEAEANGVNDSIKELLGKFDFSELKDIKAYVSDKIGRLKGSVTGGTPLARPKIKTPKGKDYKGAAKKVWDKLEIKKAFEETKENHFI